MYMGADPTTSGFADTLQSLADRYNAAVNRERALGGGYVGVTEIKDIGPFANDEEIEVTIAGIPRQMSLTDFTNEVEGWEGMVLAAENRTSDQVAAAQAAGIRPLAPIAAPIYVAPTSVPAEAPMPAPIVPSGLDVGGVSSGPLDMETIPVDTGVVSPVLAKPTTTIAGMSPATLALIAGGVALFTIVPKENRGTIALLGLGAYFVLAGGVSGIY